MACYPGGKVVDIQRLIGCRAAAYRNRVQTLGLPQKAHLEEAAESELAAEGTLGRFLPGWLPLLK